MPGRGVVALLIVGICLSACSGDGDGTSSSGPTSSGSGSGATAPSTTGAAATPSSGTVVLGLGSTTATLQVQLCIQTPAGGLNLTAVGDGNPAPTLTVNVAKPMSASTLVYTTRNTDNSFTTHSMAASESTQGSVDGLRVRVDGSAVEQAYTAAGEANGEAKSETVTVDALCQVIRPPNPPRQFVSTTAPDHDENEDEDG